MSCCMLLIISLLYSEILWYVWSQIRRQELTSYLRNKQARDGCRHALHKPLLLVVLVYVVVAAWGAWTRYATGAVVSSVYFPEGLDKPLVEGRVWMWRGGTFSDCQQPGRKKLVLIIHGAGMGAIPYARFACAMAKHLKRTVICLEDPRDYSMHHFYLPSNEPVMVARHWVRMYVHACGLAGVTRSSEVDVFSHSNGSFRAICICNSSHLPPSRALFYEPTAVRRDWLPCLIAKPKVLLTWLLWLVVPMDETCVKQAVAVQSATSYTGSNLVPESLLLGSTLRPGVEYAVDTSDDDTVMSTAEVHARIDAQRARAAAQQPGVELGKLHRLTHRGHHGSFVDLNVVYSDASMRHILQGWE
jgi:hypothetical protein